MELIDIYDANMHRRGSMSRDEAHRLGEWHRTVHLWLAHGQNGGQLFFQLRGPDVAANPGKLDATCAGHLLAGEGELEGLREVREELGIETPQPVHHLGHRTEIKDLPDGTLNREFQLIFLALAPFGPIDFAPDPAEVHGVFAVGLQAVFDVVDSGNAAAEASGIMFDPSGNWRPVTREFALSDLVPRFPRYYANVAIMAERLLSGRFPLAIG